MNSYFEQSGFYGGHGQTGAEQAYRFPLGLGVNPYGPPSGQRQVDSYDQSSAAAAAAAAAAASCKLYEQQYKLDCSKADQNGYSSTGIVKSDNNSAISSWAAAAAAAAAAAGAAQQGVDRSGSGGHVVHNNVNNRGVVGGGYPGVVSNVSGGGPEAAVAVSAVTPRSAGPNSVGPNNNNPWSPCSLNATTAVAPVPQHGGGVVSQHTQHSQHQHNAQQHHNTGGQHAISQQQSPQSQSSAHTFYPWMAIAGKSLTIYYY